MVTITSLSQAIQHHSNDLVSFMIAQLTTFNDQHIKVETSMSRVTTAGLMVITPNSDP